MQMLSSSTGNPGADIGCVRIIPYSQTKACPQRGSKQTLEAGQDPPSASRAQRGWHQQRGPAAILPWASSSQTISSLARLLVFPLEIAPGA